MVRYRPCAPLRVVQYCAIQGVKERAYANTFAISRNSEAGGVGEPGGGVGYASIVQLLILLDLIFACVPRRDFICRLGCGRLVAGRDPFPFPP